VGSPLAGLRGVAAEPRAVSIAVFWATESWVWPRTVLPADDSSAANDFTGVRPFIDSATSIRMKCGRQPEAGVVLGRQGGCEPRDPGESPSWPNDRPPQQETGPPMTEQIDNLKATVAELEAELQSIATLDAESRAVLEQAVLDILAALHKATPGERPAQSAIERLHAAAQEFEETHPTVTGILSRLIDGLGQMGI